MRGYKVLTHDGRSPIRGGELILNGALPLTLPPVAVDEGLEECSYGWNFTESIEAGFRIAGLWPTGRPSRVFAVEASDPVVMRGDKRRAITLTLLEEVRDGPINDAILRMSAPLGAWQEEMAREQILWREASMRPNYDVAAVETALDYMLGVRKLGWSLKRYGDTRAAWNTRAVWDAEAAWASWNTRAARAAKEAWDTRFTWEAKEAWDTRFTWEAREAWDIRFTWEAREAWDTRAAWAAWEAWAALTLWFASRRQWINDPEDWLTVGIRDAYRCGLEIAIPVAADILGYVMVDRGR